MNDRHIREAAGRLKLQIAAFRAKSSTENVEKTQAQDDLKDKAITFVDMLQEKAPQLLMDLVNLSASRHATQTEEAEDALFKSVRALWEKVERWGIQAEVSDYVGASVLAVAPAHMLKGEKQDPVYSLEDEDFRKRIFEQVKSHGVMRAQHAIEAARSAGDLVHRVVEQERKLELQARKDPYVLVRHKDAIEKLFDPETKKEVLKQINQKQKESKEPDPENKLRLHMKKALRDNPELDPGPRGTKTQIAEHLVASFITALKRVAKQEVDRYFEPRTSGRIRLVRKDDDKPRGGQSR